MNTMPKAEVRTAEINGNTLRLSIKITCAYNPLVHSPKVTVLFKKAEETRYIPILVQTYYQNVDLETCTIIAEYKYTLNNIFRDIIKDENVTFSIDLLYGEDRFENIDTEVTGDIVSGEEFEISTENGITIQRTTPFADDKNSILLSAVKGIVGGTYSLIIRIFGVLFIPWLVFDSFMAYFDFKSGYISKADRTLVRYVIDYVRTGFKAITREEIGRGHLKKSFVILLSHMFRKSKVVPNRVTFLSNRRGDLSGNFEDIYSVIQDDSELEIKMLLDPEPMHRMRFRDLYMFSKLYATSAVVLIDDFYELTSFVEKKEEVKLVQVWHACGAFKTFGFSRLGKPGGPRQTNKNHRSYDRAIVSSSEIRRFYAEGFGIPIENVVATGIPRTDMFFNDAIKEKKRLEIYESHPELKDKKIIMFAPTFRGNGRLTGNYPMEKFDLEKVCESIGKEYVILVKMHPFVNNPVVIPEKYKDRIYDFSENSELNDLLIITDLLITDYSSAVFEASLLDIPMLFYAYDLSEYIATRDFYYEYEPFLPGKLVQTLPELITAINENDFETEKIAAFKNRFFDHLDGKSSERVADMIKELVVKPDSVAKQLSADIKI